MRHLIVLFVGVVVGAAFRVDCSPVVGDDLAPNGSFEKGTGAPDSWHSSGGGQWVEESNKARGGTHYLAAVRSAQGPAWESESMAVEPGMDYRLEGWLRLNSGKAWIGVEFVDQAGTPPRIAHSPTVDTPAEWQYVAVESNADQARTARIVFHVEGNADLDQVALVPVAIRYIGNRGVEKDSRGRLGFWQDESAELLPQTKRGGARRFDDDVKREGKSSVVLEPESADHYFAISTVPFQILPWTDRLRISAWARCQDGASAQLAACWVDRARTVVRIDVSPEQKQTDWQELRFELPTPPAQASDLRLVASARGGAVWFDDFDLQFLRPSQPLVRVFVNQIGYGLQGPKSAVIATNFFPSDSPTVRWELRGEGCQSTDQRTLTCSGRIHSGTPDDWGWYFWRADFSSFQRPGTYTAMALAMAKPGMTVRGESAPFLVQPNVLVDQTASLGVDFFFVQRCGFAVPGWHAACHLDDARLPDGTHLDATGGWHSAGDYNKPMYVFGDSAAVYALAVVFDEYDNKLAQFDRNHDGIPDALDEAWWGAKFLAKMQNPDDGSLRGDVNQGPDREWMRWTAPDVHTDNTIGTADDPVIRQPVGSTPLAVAGWTRLAGLLNDRKISNDYLERALRLWRYYTSRDGAIGNSLLFLGALELHRATGEDQFKDFADQSVDAFLKAQRSDGSYSGDSGDHGDWTAAALALYGLQYSDDQRDERVRASLTKYLEFCLSRADNPFGLTLQGPAGDEPVFFHPSVGLGVNFWILGRAWAAALIHQLTGDQRAQAYAIDQIDWVFGKNPVNLCMFEGRGVFNPPRYHHRYNMIPGRERGAVPGAIANGFVSDMGIADRPGFDLSTGGSRSPSYRTSEPWLVHNIVHLLAVSALLSEDGQ